MCYQVPKEHTCSCRCRLDHIKIFHEMPKMPDLGRMTGWEISISRIRAVSNRIIREAMTGLKSGL